MMFCSKFIYTLMALIASSTFLSPVTALPRPNQGAEETVTTGRMNEAAVASEMEANLHTTNGTVANKIEIGFIPMSRTHPARGSSLDIQPPQGNAESGDSNDGQPQTARMTLMENSDSALSGTKVSLESFESFFGVPFDKNATGLESIGRVDPAPWPSDYWPSHRDGINHIYEGETMSPVEKFAAMKGEDAKQLSEVASQTSGIDFWAHRPPCTSNADCQSANDGSVCGIRRGAQSGHCIPTWFGLCHAWAPAAIMEPEPRCPVTENGVTFSVMDIKALITQMYDGSHIGTYFAGSRCSEQKPPVDQFGRYSDFTCRDVTPDFFHIAVANIIGRLKRSFRNSEVWNQPVLSYQSQSNPISMEDAINYVSPGQTSYVFNENAKSFVHVTTILNYIVEGAGETPISDPGVVNQFVKNKTYQYVLEVDENGVIIGGEWVGESKGDHPDFIWVPTTKPDADTVSAGIDYRTVRSLLERSQSGCPAAAVGGASPGDPSSMMPQ